jgi:hypothetical protein
MTAAPRPILFKLRLLFLASVVLWFPLQTDQQGVQGMSTRLCIWHDDADGVDAMA